MLVSGDGQMMRTVGLVSGLRRIKTTLVKDADRDDHGIAISTRSDMPWRWRPSRGDVRFVWEGNLKAIIGQFSSTTVPCGDDRTYVVDISVTPLSVTMEDDWCGALQLSDTLGGSTALYAYVGADADSTVRQFQNPICLSV